MWGDYGNGREVRPVAGGVAGEQAETDVGGMGADVEVRKQRAFATVAKALLLLFKVLLFHHARFGRKRQMRSRDHV